MRVKKLNNEAKKRIVKAVQSLNLQEVKNPYIKPYGIRLTSTTNPIKLRKYLLKVERSRAKPKDNDNSTAIYS